MGAACALLSICSLCLVVNKFDLNDSVGNGFALPPIHLLTNNDPSLVLRFMISKNVIAKVPNRVEMVHERIQRMNLMRFKTARRKHHMFNAAAKLWCEGVPWAKAMEIVTEAFDACVADDA